MDPVVVSVSASSSHAFSKCAFGSITLIRGLGVEGDVHFGATVKHRSRVARDPSQPNLRQVHLLHEELFDELRAGGFRIRPSELGENITTRGIDLLGLPRGTRLHIGSSAVVEVTGLRNPCTQIEQFRTGLLAAVLARAADGSVVRKAGIMGVVAVAGEVHLQDRVAVEMPPGPHYPLEPV